MEQLEEVVIRVFEGGNPTAPGFLLGKTDEGNSLAREAVVFGVDVVNAEVHHDAVGVSGGAFDGFVKSDAQSHVTEPEGYKVTVV